MFSHPVTILGGIVMVLGWVVLIGGGASDASGVLPMAVVNFHALSIGSGMILTGGFLGISGVFAKGFLSVGAALSEAATSEKAAHKPSFAAGAGSKRAEAREKLAEVDPEEALKRKLMEKGFSA